MNFNKIRNIVSYLPALEVEHNVTRFTIELLAVFGFDSNGRGKYSFTKYVNSNPVKTRES